MNEENFMLTAREIMTDGIVTIHPEASVKDAIELVLKLGVSGLPVTDHEGHLVGVITEYALLAITYDHEVSGETVAKHMTTEVLTIDVDDPINKAADLCIIHRVRRVPVMESGHLVGLISRRDVLKAIHESHKPVCTA
jgi:tRNA nucleotidyltransferase (CCA-adding enzyme)